MKVLLVSMPMRHGGATAIFPLGLSYISAAVRKAGHEVELLDLNRNYDWDRKRIERYLSEANFDVAGISAMITDFVNVQTIAKIIRICHPKPKVILGGGLGTTVPELMLRETEVDIVVAGEGDVTIVELLDALESDGEWRNVPGLCYLSGDETTKSPPRTLIPSLDSLPHPDRELFDLDFYLRTPDWWFNVPKADIITSRGCPYQCIFCDQAIFTRKFRPRSAESLVREIQYLKSEHGVKALEFRDDSFNINRKRVMAFCREMERTKTHIWFTCNCRINHVDDEMLAAMRRVGCVGITYGIETGDENVLKQIKKGHTLEQVRYAVRATRAQGMIVGGYMMLGFPGETRESMERSVALCAELGLSAIFSIVTPIPGTELFDQAFAAGKVKSVEEVCRNWSNTFAGIACNLTDIPDDELWEFKRKAEDGLRLRVLFANPRSLLQLWHNYARANGWGGLLARILRSIKTTFRRLHAPVPRTEAVLGWPK
ncbi:B12-binding domain-containing radical SAM protein [Elusimicrobiota bacterium]